MEGLSTLEYVEIQGKIKDHRKKDLTVNHLLFTDDVMLFSKANHHYVKQIEGVLNEFADASGLIPNLRKSKIVFSRGVETSVRNVSKFKEGVLLVKHLGIPLHLKRLNKCHY